MTSNANKSRWCDICTLGEIEVVATNYPRACIAEIQVTPVETDVAENLPGISKFSRRKRGSLTSWPSFLSALLGVAPIGEWVDATTDDVDISDAIRMAFERVRDLSNMRGAVPPVDFRSVCLVRAIKKGRAAKEAKVGGSKSQLLNARESKQHQIVDSQSSQGRVAWKRPNKAK
jgi:hypothetical protein